MHLMMGGLRSVSKEERERILNDLPAEIISQCRSMAKEIRSQRGDVRDKKILAARIRMCSGYYDSDRVIRTISSCLLSEVTTNNFTS